MSLKLDREECLNDCQSCNSLCTKERFHKDSCFCGNKNCSWQGTDFLVDPLFDFDSSLPCGEETPDGICTKPQGHSYVNKPCMCPVECDCRGKTCDRRAPLEHQTSEPKVLDFISGHVCNHTTLLTPLPESHSRPIWHETWMETAHAVGKRSYDPRLQVGAIIVSEDNSVVLSLGYNGNFAGGPNTPDSNEPGQSGFIHAETNALIKCAYHYPMKKVMYVTHSPCKNCSKMIVNAGISRVIYDIEYRDVSGIDLMRSVGITVEKFSDLLVRK